MSFTFSTINYSDYRDKVLGCYVGKTIGGTFGAPYEGMKQRIHKKYDNSVGDRILVNDDLDLQLLFFSAVKKYGESINSNILAEYFLEKYAFSAGEYAYFKKNFERGILPPYSGSFNNMFYGEGMGAVIRGELWGCLFAHNPQKAMEYARKDGILDHSDESVFAIMFLSALVSLSFVDGAIEKNIVSAAEMLPPCKFKKMVLDVVSHCKSAMTEDEIYCFVLAEYGHPDCTNVFQNMAFVLIGLLRKFDDFAAMCTLVNSFGYDTDCTVGIVGSIYGIYYGGKALLSEIGRDDVNLVSNADCPKYGGSIKSFAFDVALYGAQFAKNDSVSVIDFNDSFNAVFESAYDFRPVTYCPEWKRNSVNYAEFSLSGLSPFSENDVSVKCPEGLSANVVSVKNDSDSSLIALNCFANGKSRFSDCALFEISVRGEKFKFGFAYPVNYKVYAPQLKLPFTIDEAAYDNYYDFFARSLTRDCDIRRYHLTFDVDYSAESACTDKLGVPFKSVDLWSDVFSVERFIGSENPCSLFVSREFECVEATEARMVIGCDDGFCVWLNGEKIYSNQTAVMYSPEKFFAEVCLKKGKNTLVYRLTRTKPQTHFSVIFTERGKLMEFPKFMLGLINQ